MLALVVALAACGDGATEVATGSQESEGAVPAEGDAQQVDCGGSVFDVSGLSGASSVSSLSGGPAGAVDDAGAPAFDPSKDWKVVTVSRRRVDLMRELEQPRDNGEGDIRTHEVRTLEQITGSTNVPGGTWLLTASVECTPRLVDGEVPAADLTLAHLPSPAATSIGLLVRERACASGASAEGRIEVIELVETAEQVRLRVGVESRGGDQTCPSNPPTPFTVALNAPVGDREVVDASVVPPRPLTLGDGPEPGDPTTSQAD